MSNIDKVKEYEAICSALDAWVESQGLDNAHACGAMCLSIGKRLGKVAVSNSSLQFGLNIHLSLITATAYKDRK